MNTVIKNAIKDFNEFKHPKENIYTFKEYCSQWKEQRAFLVITCDYEVVDQDDRVKCNIHYKDNFFGSYKFNRWLRRYDFEFQFHDEKEGYIYLKILFD
jgi:hypothetical protein